MPRTGISHDRHTRFDPELGVNVRGVHGHHAYCACGWEGEIRKAAGEAQFDAKVHRGWHRMRERGL